MFTLRKPDLRNSRMIQNIQIFNYYKLIQFIKVLENHRLLLKICFLSFIEKQYLLIINSSFELINNNKEVDSTGLLGGS